MDSMLSGDLHKETQVKNTIESRITEDKIVDRQCASYMIFIRLGSDSRP